MSIFSNNITNIINSGYVDSLTSSKKKQQIVEAIKSGSIDTINFSKESQNLLRVTDIDSMLDGIFGVPSSLDSDQLSQLESLRVSLDKIFPNQTSSLDMIDVDEIYKNLGITDANEEQVKKLSTELGEYITELSISKLFGDETNLSSFSGAFNKIFDEKLTQDDFDKLGTLSTQLNRLLFGNNNSEVSSYLNTYNELYKLNNPTRQELQDASSLLTKRNILLSSILLNRDNQQTY